MTYCVSCGAENADGTQFCVRCGNTLAPTPAPESWRNDPSGPAAPTIASSSGGGYNPGSYNPPPPSQSPSSGAGGYTAPPPGNVPTYNPQQSPMNYQPAGSAQPMHPAVPALVSFFLPGAGLLFVPNKAGVGMGIIGGYIGLTIILFIIAFLTLGIGSCLFLFLPLANVAAA